ncbi:MAG: hypothetical protein RL497_1397 [Pseudomonadota bacterium]|jgi:RND family efflux transporter MFP subunit
MAHTAPIVFLLFLFSVLAAGCNKPQAPSEQARPVRTTITAANQQHLMAEYAGTIVARVESQLAFRVGGKIQARKVDVGSRVKSGQTLMQLDTQDLTLGLNQAQANAHSAQTQYDLASKELKRFRDLHASGAISLSMLDAKNAAFEAAKAYFEQAQAQRREREHQTQYAHLKADMNGVVTAIHAEIGQVVAAGLPVVTLAQMDEHTTHNASAKNQPSDLEMEIAIPENNIELINKADAIEIQLWASRKEVFRGHIREISPVANPITRAFSAKISFIDITEKQAQLLKLGMTAAAKFLLTTPQAYIKLPLSALRHHQGQTQVWQVVQGQAKPITVSVAGIDDNDVLIKGLEPGQTIITAGVHVLTEGQAVTLLPAVAPPAQSASALSAHAIMAPKNSAPATPSAQVEPTALEQKTK